MMILRLAFKEVFSNKRLAFLLLSNLAIGLIGLITLENYKKGFTDSLDKRSKNILGGDISVASRFPFSGEMEKKVEKLFIEKGDYREISIKTLFSMAKGSESSRLIFLHSYEEGFPFYGNILLKKKGLIGEGQKNIKLKDDEVWVYPEVLFQLSLSIGDELSVGGHRFKISDVVLKDSQQTFEMGSVAAKVFISKEGIERAGLIQKGSTIRYESLYQTNFSIDKSFAQSLENLIDDNSVRVTTPRKASQQVGRVLNYLSDFLGLVGLVALLMSGVGLFYLLRSYLASRRISFAIYNSLGIPKRDLQKLYWMQLSILGLVGSLIAILIASLFIPLINFLLSSVLPFDFHFTIQLRAIVIGLISGTIGVMSLALPLILSLSRNSPSDLFQEVGEGEVQLKAKPWPFIPYFIFYLVMAVYVSQSLLIGISFVAGLSLLVGVFFVLGLLTLNRLKKISFKILPLKLSLKYLSSYKMSTLSIFLSLFLGSLLLNLIPQLEKNIKQEISWNPERPLPSLFLFDIQDEQVEEVSAFFKKRELELLSLSPIIRSRLLSINEKKVQIASDEALTREAKREARFRNRGVNLTYRKSLSWTEKIIEGRDFSGVFQEEGGLLAEVSIEQRYASRLGIDLNDTLEFDILGVPIKAKVISVRSVKWTSFLPNFFLQFQPGVLDNAPKTWLASVPDLKTEKDKSQLQLDLYEAFPNVSAIDISRVVSRILGVMTQMSKALSSMSLLSLFVGLTVLFSISRHQAQSRVNDIVLLKILGLKGPRLQNMLVLEFILIAFAASFFGVLISIVLCLVVSNILFEGLWSFDWALPLSIILGVCTLSALTSLYSIRNILKVSPRKLLGA